YSAARSRNTWAPSCVGERSTHMICLALGLGVLGFVAARKARRCHRGWHGHHGGYGWGPPWAHGRHGHGRGRQGLYMALAHIDASPAQERAIIGEVDKLKERLWAAKTGIKESRG